MTPLWRRENKVDRIDTTANYRLSGWSLNSWMASWDLQSTDYLSCRVMEKIYTQRFQGNNSDP